MSVVAVAMAVMVVMMIMMVVVIMVVTIAMAVLVRMALMRSSAEETAHFMRSQVGNDVGSGLEAISNTLDIMCLHNTEHHFFVDSERHIYLGAFHNCGPMLITDGMPKLDRDTDNIFR